MKTIIITTQAELDALPPSFPEFTEIQIRADKAMEIVVRKTYGSSTVTAYDSSTVRAYDSSTVTACDFSTVTACDSSTVTARVAELETALRKITEASVSDAAWMQLVALGALARAEQEGSK